MFTYPRLDETLYVALKTAKGSSTAVANVSPMEKIYRRQTDTILDMAKPLFLSPRQRKEKELQERKSIKNAHCPLDSYFSRNYKLKGP